MTNALYELGRFKMLAPGTLGPTSGDAVDWVDDDIRCALVNVSGSGTLYAPDMAQDEFLGDVPAAAIIATSGLLTGKAASTGTGATFRGGIADADDVVFTSVGPSGTTIEALVIYKDTGSAATSPLIAYIDVATGLPITANGGNITVAWSDGPNRVFRV